MQLWLHSSSRHPFLGSGRRRREICGGPRSRATNEGQRRRASPAGESAPASFRPPSPRPRPDRHARGLRARRLRLLHGAARRGAGAIVPDARGPGRGSRGDDDRGPRPRWRATASGAAGFPRVSRAPVRVLHAGIRDVGGRAARAASASDHTRNRGGDRRQPLPLHRLEDDRLLRGHGRFTDDIDDGALECCFVRSPYAHARITGIDAGAARGVPGVVAVYTAADLPFGGVDLPLLIPHPNLTQGRTQRCLASEVVRYAGEAVAFVVAESRYIAEDAAELVQVEYEPLPVVITPEAAARAEHLVHDDVPGNVAAEMLQEAGEVDAALARAPHRK